MLRTAHITRRDFLHRSAMSAVGIQAAHVLGLPGVQLVDREKSAKSCILILNTGAPSHLDTFDTKPDSPREIRGPFSTIRTNNPEIQVSELFPLHARIADKFSLVRSCHHSEPLSQHDAGLQIAQTGKLYSRSASPAPHAGAVIQYLFEKRNGLPSHVVLPKPLGITGGNVPQGQSAGFLGSAFEPVHWNAGEDFDAHTEAARRAFDIGKEQMKTQERYGLTPFGQSCLLARRLVQNGVPFVTINTCSTVFNQATWDIHGFAPFSSFSAMKDIVAPIYDRGYSALVEDLHQRGMLDQTLVVVLSEFGRTPRMNAAGGRDHWHKCWTSVFAGGGIKGGRVVGKSDAHGAEPIERPVTPQELLATIYTSMGIDLRTSLPRGDGTIPLIDPGIEAIRELI